MAVTRATTTGALTPVGTFLPSAADYAWDPHRRAFAHPYDRDLQLFVVWARARIEEERILGMLAEEFRILKRYEVHWSPERVENNFERLYATGVGLGSGKTDDAGVGPFLLVVAEDLDPVYQYRRNVSGYLEITNVRVARVKRSARALIGGYGVHSSNSLTEFFRDATLLLGPARVDELLAQDAPPAMPLVEQLHTDLVGAEGWTDLTELIDVLRRTTQYAVLRNVDGLPELLDVDPEVDVLARDQCDFAAIVNGSRLDPGSGAAFTALLGGRRIVFDVRWVGDGYFDARWEERMLARRDVPDATVAHLRLDDHFFSLLYHAKLQKPAVRPGYVKLLSALAGDLDLPRELAEHITEDDVAAAVLDGYLSGNGFAVPQPADQDVHRNAPFAARLRMTAVEADADQLVRRQLWLRARHSRVGSWAAESDRLRAVVRRIRARRAPGRAADGATGARTPIPPAPAEGESAPSSASPPAPVGRPPRPTGRRTVASRLAGRIAVVRRYGIPVFSTFVKDTETSATVFLNRRGTLLVGKYFLDTPRARAELSAERRSWELFGDRPWRMPVERWGRRSMLVRRLPDDARLDVRAHTMSAQERLDAAARTLDVLLEIYLAGYLHGDLQPHNIWFLDGRLVATDWSTSAPRSEGLPFSESADISGNDPAYAQRFDPAFDPEDGWSFPNTLGVTLDEAAAALRRELTLAAEHSADARTRLTALEGLAAARAGRSDREGEA